MYVGNFSLVHLAWPSRLRTRGCSRLIGVPLSLGMHIPVTYVPARNLIFLSLTLGWAEALGAHDIFIGVNALDYSGYPDCRPEFIASFAETARLATKEERGGASFAVHPRRCNSGARRASPKRRTASGSIPA